MSINKIFEQLKATPSKLAKLDILKKNASNDTLKQAIFLALDPFTQFYQKKIPEYKPKKATLDLDDAMLAVRELSSRKVTGNAAIEYLAKLLSSLSADDAEALKRIVTKDLDCGMQESTANKIWKDLIPTFPCMLASGYEQKLVDKIKFPAIAQCKMDGMRFNAIVDAQSRSVEYRSRNGKELFINNWVLDEAFLGMAKNIGMSAVVFDGELIVVDDDGKPLDRKTGNGILNKAGKGTISDPESKQVRAILWDVIPMAHFKAERCDVPYKDRLATLVIAIDNLGDNFRYLTAAVETSIVDSAAAAQKLFEKYLNDGQEGIILKDGEGIWENKRSKGQIKFKGELECDLICVGWEEGTGKNKGKLGALVLQSSDAKVNVSVGTGLSDSQRGSIKPDDVLNKIVAVKYNARISNRQGEDSLFLPVFIEVRDDKTDADASKDIK